VTIVGDTFTILSGISLALALALAKVINYAPRVLLQIVVSFTDDPRGFIYNYIMFIVLATVMILPLLQGFPTINTHNTFMPT
jgi:hypothetical protein